MNNHYSFLAAPYTHVDPGVMEARYHEAMRCMRWLLNQRIWVYCPIVHCHSLAKHYDLPRDFSYWLDYNQAFLIRARRLYILTLDGWQDSAGIDWEVDYCRRLHIPIEFIHPTVLTYELKEYSHVEAKDPSR